MNNTLYTCLTLNNTAYHYDTKQDDSDGYYGYDVNETLVIDSLALIVKF
jgi:hypothetical protein